MKASAVGSTKASRFTLPCVSISDGSVEVIKWVALVLMTCDHVDKYWLHASVPLLYDVGRLAMPLFGFVLAFNLARPGAFERGLYQRAMKRLALAGAFATPAFVGLGGLLGGWWPLNIMFMLLTVTAALFLFQRDGRATKFAAFAVVLVGGSSVEFWWPAVGFCLAVWCYCKRPSWAALIAAVVCLGLLQVINRNAWALAAPAVIVAAASFNVRVPRVRYAFYAYYPLHLTVIWAVQALSS